MSILVSGKGGKDFDPVPAGVHIARCYAIYDVGTQKTEWQGSEKWARKVVFAWEIPDERMDIEKDGKKLNLPRAISKIYTASLGPKANLRKDLVNWRGKDFTPAEIEKFDLKNILGKSCQLQVVHEEKKDGKVFANVSAIMSLPKGMKHEPPENPLKMWSIGDATDGVPAWILKKAGASKEWIVQHEETHEPPQDEPEGEAEAEEDEPLPF